VPIPRNGGSPPRDNNDVNIINFINVVSLFVIIVWLMNDTPESLIATTIVSVLKIWEPQTPGTLRAYQGL
jgi:hypothetical protein